MSITTLLVTWSWQRCFFLWKFEGETYMECIVRWSQVIYSLHHSFSKRDPNLRQWRCLKLLKDYEITILYPLRQGNYGSRYIGLEVTYYGKFDCIVNVGVSFGHGVQSLANNFVRFSISESGRVLACVEVESFH